MVYIRDTCVQMFINKMVIGTTQYCTVLYCTEPCNNMCDNEVNDKKAFYVMTITCLKSVCEK